MEHGLVGVPSAEVGVYYERKDYARFLRRLAIEVIDITVAAVLWFVAALAVFIVMIEEDHPPMWIAFVILAFVAFGYFVLLKRSPVRTLGYKLCGARIVNLQGERPGIPSLTLRLLFGGFGPLNFLFDLIWIPGDRHRQALCDKFARTYVVKAGARPCGRGRIEYKHYFVLGQAFIFAEVRPDGESGGAVNSSAHT